MWLLAVGVGMVCGKTIIHGIVLSRWLRLKMFRADQVNIKQFRNFLTIVRAVVIFDFFRISQCALVTYIFSSFSYAFLKFTYCNSEVFRISTKYFEFFEFFE